MYHGVKGVLVAKISRGKKTLVGILVAIAVLVAFWAVHSVLNPTYNISGKITDSDNGNPVQGVVLRSGDHKYESQSDGSYKIDGLKKNTQITVIPPKGYVTPTLTIDYSTATKSSWDEKALSNDISLEITQDEKKSRLLEGIKKIYDAFQYGRYGDDYDLMQSDSKKTITKDKYIATLEKGFGDITITDYKISNPTFLDKWYFKQAKKSYQEVAQADISFKVQVSGINQTINQSVHFIKEGGQWRWFYSPNGD